MNWYRRAQYDHIEDVYAYIDDAYDDMLREFFYKGRKRGTPMSWTVVPFARLKKIWEDYVKMGFVRDEAGINEIANQMLKNLARLQAATDLSGHSEVNTDELLKEKGYPPLKDGSAKADDFYWNFLETAYGTPISDYGLKPLWTLAQRLTSAPTAEKKLVIIDQMLNVVHQRGDLAALFVEGGSGALSQLSAAPEPQENEEIVKASSYIANELRTNYPYTLEETIKMQGKNGLPINVMDFQELKWAKELEEQGVIKKVVKKDDRGHYTAYVIN